MKLDGMTLILLAFNHRGHLRRDRSSHKILPGLVLCLPLRQEIQTPARAHASARLVPHKPLILPQAFTQTTSRVTHEPLCLRPGRCPFGLLLGTLPRPQHLGVSARASSTRARGLSASTRVGSLSTTSGLSTCPCSRAGRSSSSSHGRDGPSLLRRDTVWRALSGHPRLPFFS